MHMDASMSFKDFRIRIPKRRTDQDVYYVYILRIGSLDVQAESARVVGRCQDDSADVDCGTAPYLQPVTWSKTW